ncbi:MAG: hypothetical protein LBO74_09365 [Candidatus Symbiothrix sp.]|nr:hypothetical protein [Candidatus Symbiothrix sp.]
MGTIRLQLVQDNEPLLLSDIDQIIGLCETIDNNSFQPYQSEDFAPAIAKKINSYYDLIDKVVDELKADTTNLKATPQKYGYTRYFRMDSMGVSLNVRFDYWEREADTPFWLFITDAPNGISWMQNESFKAKIKNVAMRYYEPSKTKALYLPIFPLIDKTEDDVVNDIADQIIKIITKLSPK